MKTPCQFCPDREVGCHSKCDKYITWDAVNRERRERAVKQAVTTSKVFEIHRKAVQKAIKGRK